MSTSPAGPPPPMIIQPMTEDHALRDMRIMLREALTKEWYRANQEGHAARDYSRRDLIKSHLEMVANWEPAAPAGGTWRDAGKKGRPVRPPAVERADRLQQMLADLPQLGSLLEQAGTVRKVMTDARAAQERTSATPSFSRWRNPFAKAARLQYPGFEHLVRRRPAPSSGSPVLPALQRTAPATIRRSGR